MVKDELYWQIRRREHEHIQEQLKREDGYKKRLERLYRTTQEEVIRDIEADIGRFADVEGISMTEAKKRIGKHDVEAFSEKVKRYVEERNFSPEAKRELRLSNVTMRTNRLELLEARMRLETTALADEENKMLEEWLDQEAIAEYTRQAGILGMTVPDRVQLNRMAKAVVNAEFRNVEFNERVWQNQKELQHGLENTIRRTIIRGENPRVAGRELREHVNKEFSNKKYAADRIAITESARVQSDIGEQAHKDAGITQYMWIAEPTACSICAGYDGEVYDYSNTSAPRVPAHPFCKCSEAAYVDSDSWDADLRARGLTPDDGDGQVMSEKKRTYDRTVNENMEQSLNKEQLDEYTAMIDNMPAKNRELWNKHLDDLKIDSTTSKTNGHMAGSISFNAKRDLSDRKFSEKGNTFFHEFGHNIDYLEGGKKLGGGKTTFHKLSNGKTLGETVYEEVQKMIKKEPGRAREQRASIYHKLVDDYENKPSIFMSISDLYGGATNNVLNVGGGHNKSYWKVRSTKYKKATASEQKEHRNKMLGAEAFAEMFAAESINSEEIEVFKKWLPESYKGYKEMLDEL